MDAAEESEQFILMEFPEYNGRDMLKTCKQYKLIGLDTDEPMIQIDRMIFKGQWMESIGTNLFYQQKDNQTEEDYFARSTKILRFRRVLLNHKEPEGANS